MMLTMIWCSIAFAKFLTPIMGGLFFNPGGEHGLLCVQQLENIVGAPGLIGILLFTALAFLTYLTTETIEIVRKAMKSREISYLKGKVYHHES